MQHLHIQKWTPDLAYAVGLIVTDGCLSSDGRHVTFTSRDIELIESMRSILNADNSIGKTKNKSSEAYRLQIGSIELFHWLERIGLTPCKSLTIGEIDVPDRLFIDFLRGHLDGDGSVTTYLDYYNSKKDPRYIYRRLWTRFISGSKKHMIWLQKMIHRSIGIHGRLHTSKANRIGNSMFVLKFAKKESMILLDKIYYSNNIPCLSRKKNTYIDFIKLQ